MCTVVVYRMTGDLCPNLLLPAAVEWHAEGLTLEAFTFETFIITDFIRFVCTEANPNSNSIRYQLRSLWHNSTSEWS